MGISERKQKQKEALKSKILDTALDIMIKKGFEEVSIRNIARQIEYSPATLYIYFKDKNDILASLCDQGFDLLLEYQSASLKISDPMIRLHSLGEQYLRFGLEHPAYYELMFILPIEHPESSETFVPPRAFQLLCDTISECIASGKMIPHSVHAVALVMWSCVHGMVTLTNQQRLKVFPDESIKGLLNTALQSLLAAYTIK